MLALLLAAAVLAAPAAPLPRVLLRTALGDVVIEVDVVHAPRTGRNFLRTGLRHVDGAISMARDGPDTATGDFFLCVGDQPSLDFGGSRNPDGQGFATFGRVVSGMEVVHRIHRSPARGQALAPPVAILDATRLEPAAPGSGR